MSGIDTILEFADSLGPYDEIKVCLCVCVCVMERLKFTVVSEPMDDDEECVDVGRAFLDLQELLLTGNDVIEQQIDSKCCVCFFVFVFVFYKRKSGKFMLKAKFRLRFYPLLSAVS